MKEIKIPSSVVLICNYAFSRCSSLKKITFEDSSLLKEIGKGSFYGCISLENISIPSTVTSINDHSFHECSLINKIFLPSVNSIGKYAFAKCSSLEEVIFDENILFQNIKEGFFSECKELKQITIPPSVTSIRIHAFDKCTSLQHMTIPSSLDIKNLATENPQIIITRV